MSFVSVDYVHNLKRNEHHIYVIIVLAYIYLFILRMLTSYTKLKICCLSFVSGDYVHVLKKN